MRIRTRLVTAITTITIAALALLSASAATAAEPPPNVLLILTDDQGYGDIASHGNEQLDTPVLDQLAEDGARFNRFYVSPVCAPTRASLLTGRYHARTNVHGVTRAAETMRHTETTLAEVFKANNYATGCFGKWHNGAHFPQHPNGQGFDTFIGFCGGHWNDYFDTHLEHNGKRIETKGYITDVITDDALNFITAQTKAKKPWFCYVPYNAPHSPWQVPDKYWQKYKDRGLDDVTACAYGMVENIDDNVGRLLKRLDELEQAENTIVLFLTDNGPNSNRYNADMKGRKGSVDEGGVRVPLFVRWKDTILPGVEIDAIAAHIDLLPTLVDLTGVKKPATKPLDGWSLAPLLHQQVDEKEWPDRMLFQMWRDRAAVRTQRWRAVRDRNKKWSLYDIQNDPQQKKDVARTNQDVLEQLGHAFAKWHREATANGESYIPTHVGHDEWPIVTLRGHEALLHPAKGQGISYYGRNGWANDWVANWTNTESYPYWPIKVVEEGKYEITLMVVCPKQNVGAKLRVEVGDVGAEVVITEAHDPPPLPVHDRVGRKESYEKVWKPLKVGTLELPKGIAMLKIKALEKPGEQVVDIKAVELKRVK